MVAARDVRNAVSSSALRRARGLPEGSRRVSEPRIVEAEAADADLSIDSGVSSSESLRAVIDERGVDEAGEDGTEADEPVEEDDIERLARELAAVLLLAEFDGLSTATTFTPKPLSLVAGMNKIVLPSFRINAVLCG